MTSLPYLDAARIYQLLTPESAVHALREALLDGLDPGSQPSRAVVPLTNGEYLLMPAEGDGVTGVKVLTVAPGNPALGRPRIQGVYVLFDAVHLNPLAVLEGTSITTLRTPAVGVAALLPLLRGRPRLRAVVFGTGPQAQAHVRTLLPFIPSISVTYVSRHPVDSSALPGSEVSWLAAGSAELATKLSAAELVVCATTARQPLFDSSRLRGGTCVIAMGSHEPDSRELDSELMGRAQVVVEDVGNALREAGDVVLAIADGTVKPDSLIPMVTVVRGDAALDPGRITVFKSTGMAWEDLVVVQAAYQSHLRD